MEEAQPSGAFCARLIFSAQLLAVLRVSCFRGSPGVKGICWAALRIIHLANMPGAPLRPRTGLDALGQAPDPQSPAPIEDITATNNCRQGDSSCFFRHTSEQEPKSSSPPKTSLHPPHPRRGSHLSKGTHLPFLQGEHLTTISDSFSVLTYPIKTCPLMSKIYFTSVPHISIANLRTKPL